MKLSVIIPTLNEEGLLPDLLRVLSGHSPQPEIVIVDGGSTDQTEQVAKHFDVNFTTSKASRAVQMNLGARNASGEVLYFVHADALPPKSFYQDIAKSIDLGHDAGCYRFRFNSSHPLLKINSYFTRFNKMWCRGGDQTLFIKKDLFQTLGGYNEYYTIMEEYDLIRTLMRDYSFDIIPKDVLVSDRKYANNSWLKVQLANLKAFKMYREGNSPDDIKKFYEANLKQSI